MPFPPGVRHTPCPTVPIHGLSFHQAGILSKKEEGVGWPGCLLLNKPGLHVSHQWVFQPNNALLKNQKPHVQNLKVNNFIVSSAHPSQIWLCDLRWLFLVFSSYITSSRPWDWRSTHVRKNHKADTVLLEPEQDVAHKSKFQQQLAEDMRKNRAPRIWVVLFKRTLRDLNTRLCYMNVWGTCRSRGTNSVFQVSQKLIALPGGKAVW